jgi:hypothetical protein
MQPRNILDLIQQGEGAHGDSDSASESGDDSYHGESGDSETEVMSEDTDLTEDEAEAKKAVKKASRAKAAAKASPDPSAAVSSDDAASVAIKQVTSPEASDDDDDAPVSDIGIPTVKLTTKAEKAIAEGIVPGHTDWPSTSDPDAVCKYILERGPWGSGGADNAVPTLVYSPASKKTFVLVSRGPSTDLKYDIRVAKPAEIKAATNTIPELEVKAKARAPRQPAAPMDTGGPAATVPKKIPPAPAPAPAPASAPAPEDTAGPATVPDVETPVSPKRKRAAASDDQADGNDCVVVAPEPKAKRPRNVALADEIVKVTISYEGAPHVSKDGDTSTRQIMRVSSERSLFDTLAWVEFLADTWVSPPPSYLRLLKGAATICSH